jgi:hypothetical protein
VRFSALILTFELRRRQLCCSALKKEMTMSRIAGKPQHAVNEIQSHATNFEAAHGVGEFFKRAIVHPLDVIAERIIESAERTADVIIDVVEHAGHLSHKPVAVPSAALPRASGRGTAG